MGVSINTIVGPYLKVEGEYEIKIPKVKRVCPFHPKKETNDKFCSECGTLVESVDYVETRSLTPQEFYWQSDSNEDDMFWCPDEDDMFWCPDYCDAILPNENPPKKIELDINGNKSVDLTNMEPIIKEQVKWFKEKYAKGIAEFVNAFGEDNVKVCWGVVTFYS